MKPDHSSLGMNLRAFQRARPEKVCNTIGHQIEVLILRSILRLGPGTVRMASYAHPTFVESAFGDRQESARIGRQRPDYGTDRSIQYEKGADAPPRTAPNHCGAA